MVVNNSMTFLTYKFCLTLFLGDAWIVEYSKRIKKYSMV